MGQKALCVALTLAAQRGHDSFSLDVTLAFLYAELPENIELFSQIPEGHPDFNKNQTHVLRVRKNLYGLKEAPRLW